MNRRELADIVAAFPRAEIGFYPTPLHRADNISAETGVDVLFKREDMAAPGPISGSKIRLAEFLVAEAQRQGITHLLTVGANISNSAAQLAAAAISSGITPVLFLYDVIAGGNDRQVRGNLLLDHLLGVEIHRFSRSASQPQEVMWDEVLYPAVESRRRELEAAGRKVMVAPAGATHPAALRAHLATYLEIFDQCEHMGFGPNHIYHTTGTGGVLPAFLAAKTLLGHDTAIRSIAITPYTEDNYINSGVILDRVDAIFDSLGLNRPARSVIEGMLDVDQRFIGPDYAHPSEEGTRAIRRLAASDAILLGPVYTAKGFAGLLAHIDEGRVKSGERVVFLHTGDAINLFEHEAITGNLREG